MKDLLDNFDNFLNSLNEEDIKAIENKHKDKKYGFDVYISILQN